MDPYIGVQHQHGVGQRLPDEVARSNDERRLRRSRRDGASPDSQSTDSGSSSSGSGVRSAVGCRPAPVCSRGSIFRHRTPAEMAAFRSLSGHCNAYEVQTSGDDAPYGKDRIRTHVLVALSAAGRPTVSCVVCAGEMVVYHDFPLVDGLLFESPMRYNCDVRVEPLTVGGLHRQPLNDASKFYLNAVCFKCLQVYNSNNNSGGFRGGPSRLRPPLSLGDGLMPSLTVMLANAKF